MLDNLFIVESPLQVLVAVELSHQFSGQNNGIIYRLSDGGREKNNNQILKMVNLGTWDFSCEVRFSSSSGLAFHWSVRRLIRSLRKKYAGSICNVFFGEFRSHWMHLARLAIAPKKHVLIDDGAATLTVKRLYIDQKAFYPTDLWSSGSFPKDLLKTSMYYGLFDKAQAKQPVSIASAFLGAESDFIVDFSFIRRLAKSMERSEVDCPRKAYFFGSKYSEAGIISREYELDFLACVIAYYQENGLEVVYCSHRDESYEKLSKIMRLGEVEVVQPDSPAEIFLLEKYSSVSEIGAAYSSVLNNLNLIFPEKPITSFRLKRSAINPKNREAIDHVYKYFEEKGVPVKSL